MKKILMALLPCIALSFTSCGDSEYEMHQTFFYPQMPGGMRIYADQQQDTIHVLSLDSWTASTSATWMTVTPTSQNIPAMSSADVKLTLKLEKNTTGQTRGGYINVASYDQISMPVIQYYWLNIRRPEPKYTSSSSVLPGIDSNGSSSAYGDVKASFPLDLKAAAADTSLIFTVYQDDATLQSSAEWVKTEGNSFVSGNHNVKVSVEANHDTAPRNAQITLTSGGISSIIEVTQEGRK